jgi:hypothetical protein
VLAVAAAAFALLYAAIAASAGVGEEGLRICIRASARVSVVLFTLAFSASSLHALWRTPASAWCLRNRRQLGLAFALSHFLHLIFLAWLAAAVPGSLDRSPGVLLGGGLAYVAIALMAATSSDRAQAWLGMRRWRRLHRVGAWYVWILFAQSYLPRALASPAYLPLALLMLAAPALRLLAVLRARRARAAAPLARADASPRA